MSIDAAGWAGLHPFTRYRLNILLQWARNNGIQFAVTDLWRSPAEQAALYADRRNNPYPVAAPGSSLHEFGLAFDCFVGEQHQNIFAEAAWSLGFRWAGTRDTVHYDDICAYVFEYAKQVDAAAPWWQRISGQGPGRAWMESLDPYLPQCGFRAMTGTP